MILEVGLHSRTFTGTRNLPSTRIDKGFLNLLGSGLLMSGETRQEKAQVGDNTAGENLLSCFPASMLMKRVVLRKVDLVGFLSVQNTHAEKRHHRERDGASSSCSRVEYTGHVE
jgi:hypothetical protein